MDMFDGFVFLEEKKKSLIPILCQYDFLSALTAAFSITSWRKNRGAQESCLALNSAMVENTEWGRKTIFTPNDLEEFFQLLYPILKTTPYYEDLGVHFKVLESVLHHLSDSSFSHDNVEFDEIAPNVIKAKATDVLNDYLSFVVENVPVEDVKSAYDFLTIVPGQLKTICDTTHPILPIWEREKRNHCFAVRPIYMSNNDYIYSPIIMEEVRKRWIEGFLQFYPPFEIGLERTCTALYAWKNNYEHLFSSEVEVLLKESGCEYAKHDVDLRREDRRGNHPTIDVLGDYDVIGLNTTQKRIFIIECKVLQPIGSVFEHSNQQKRFFTKEKFDEKFQKRIDYFSKVAMSFFANHGYDTEGFTINPYMVVNKVFSSYYKHVQFPIVTFDELKREIQL